MLNTAISQPTIVGIFVLIFMIVNKFASSLNPEQELKCLGCIRNVSNLMGIDTSKRCESYYCGQFQLSYTYWAEAGKPGNNQGSRDYEKCARDKSCAEQTVRSYFKKFKRDCNNDGLIDCLDMAALHKGGPASCASDWFYKSRYWVAFNKTSCMTNRDLDNPKSDFGEQSNQPVRLMKNQTLTSECLDCICDAISGCNTGVNNCASGTVCGPFAISQAFWKDGRKPGASWTACARTKECSSVTMKNYMEKYKKDCNGDGYITCEDYAAIHRRGPRACNNKDLLKDHYWNKFLACRANQKPVKDVNMVKVSNSIDEMETQSSLASQGDALTSLNSTADQPMEPMQSATIQTSAPSTTTSHSTSTTATSPSSRFDYSQTSTYEPTSVINEKEDYSTRRPDIRPNMRQPTSPSENNYPSSVHQATTQVKNSELTFSSRPFSSLPTTPTAAQTNPTSGTSTTSTSHLSTNSLPLIVVQTTGSRQHLHPVSRTPPRDHNEDHLTTKTHHPATVKIENQPANLVAQSIPTFAPLDQSMAQHISGEELDFTIPNFPFPVSDLPLFPDSYPMPESVRDKQQDSDLRSKSRPKPTDNRSRNPSQESKPQSANPNLKQSNESSSKNSSKNQLGPNTTSGTPKSTISPQQQEKKDSDIDTSSLLPPISMADSPNLVDMGLNESSRIASECLECICDASSNCDTTVQCISKQREKNRCGLYMISWNQYQESDISLTSIVPLPAGTSEETADEKMYYECTTDKVCAEKLIHLYIEKHQKDCNNDGKIDCYDIAALHRVGPDNCNSGKFLGSQYWRDFNICYTTDRLTTTVQLQSSPQLNR